MRMTLTHSLTVAAAAIALNAGGAEARGYDRGHGASLERDARRIDSVAHDLEDEFRLHYRHTDGYRHMTADLREVIRSTHHILELADDCYVSVRHIAADLRELDRLAHHLHEVVDRAEARGRGHTHGDTRHVHRLLGDLNGAIHRMQDTVEDIRRFGAGGACDLEPRGHGGRDDRGYERGRPGFSYRYDSAHGPSFRISIGGHR